MTYGVRYSAKAIGHYWIVDLGDDERRVGSVTWRPGVGYCTWSVEGDLVVVDVPTLEEARQQHEQQLAQTRTGPGKTEGMKRCKECNEWKSEAQFPLMASGRRRGMCRSCVASYHELTWREREAITQMDLGLGG